MKKLIITAVIVGVIIFAGYLLTSDQMSKSQVQVNQQPAAVLQSQNTAQTQVQSTAQTIGANHEVVYTDSGYSPSELTIKAGDAVTFKNESSLGMWTASAMHPSHVLYSGTSLQEHCPDTANTVFDECTSAQLGQSWSFTFTKTGTWGYHNHVKPRDFGKIIVE